MLAFTIPGPTEWMLIFVLFFFVFGAKKLPEFARGISEAIREFHKSRDEITKALKEDDKK